jgi:hypothetical protein
MDCGRRSTRHDREERDFKGPLYAKTRDFAMTCAKAASSSFIVARTKTMFDMRGTSTYTF